MNILILINSAPHHRPFFSRVGDELRKRGHEVVYAVDSRFSEFHYPGVRLAGPTYIFSEYFEAHYATAAIADVYHDLNLWTAMVPDLDRAKYGPMYRSPEYYVRLLPNLVQFFHEIMVRHRIDCVVYEPVSNTFAYVAQQVGAKNGAAYMGFACSRLPNRTDAFDSQWARDSSMPRVYAELLSGERHLTPAEQERVTQYRASFHEQAPDYMIAQRELPENPVSRYARKRTLERMVRSFRYLATVRAQHWYAFQVPNPLTMYFRQFAFESLRAIRARTLRARFYEPADFSRGYFAYAMHFHPESSTSVAAPMYVDELTNIQNVAASLPYGLWLYVKDHRDTNAARMPIGFYRQVVKIPNVKLIDPATNSQELVRHARAVVTTAGTMGYEAIVLGKPAYVLGNTFYDFHPLCVRLSSFDGAFEAFSRWLTVQCTDAEIEAFVASYFLCSLEGSYDFSASSDGEPTLTSVVNAIERRGASDQHSRASAAG